MGAVELIDLRKDRIKKGKRQKAKGERRREKGKRKKEVLNG
jgi:hypothetical protein